MQPSDLAALLDSPAVTKLLLKFNARDQAVVCSASLHLRTNHPFCRVLFHFARFRLSHRDPITVTNNSYFWTDGTFRESATRRTRALVISRMHRHLQAIRCSMSSDCKVQIKFSAHRPRSVYTELMKLTIKKIVHFVMHKNARWCTTIRMRGIAPQIGNCVRVVCLNVITLEPLIWKYLELIGAE